MNNNSKDKEEDFDDDDDVQMAIAMSESMASAAAATRHQQERNNHRKRKNELLDNHYIDNIDDLMTNVNISSSSSSSSSNKRICEEDIRSFGCYGSESEEEHTVREPMEASEVRMLEGSDNETTSIRNASKKFVKFVDMLSDCATTNVFGYDNLFTEQYIKTILCADDTFSIFFYNKLYRIYNIQQQQQHQHSNKNVGSRNKGQYSSIRSIRSNSAESVEKEAEEMACITNASMMMGKMIYYHMFKMLFMCGIVRHSSPQSIGSVISDSELLFSDFCQELNNLYINVLGDRMKQVISAVVAAASPITNDNKKKHQQSSSTVRQRHMRAKLLDELLLLKITENEQQDSSSISIYVTDTWRSIYRDFFSMCNQKGYTDIVSLYDMLSYFYRLTTTESSESITDSLDKRYIEELSYCYTETIDWNKVIKNEIYCCSFGSNNASNSVSSTTRNYCVDLYESYCRSSNSSNNKLYNIFKNAIENCMKLNTDPCGDKNKYMSSFHEILRSFCDISSFISVNCQHKNIDIQSSQ